MAVHQRNTHSRSRQHVPRLSIHLTSEELAALGRLQRRHHLKSKDDALRLAIYRLGVQRKTIRLSLTDQALCALNMPSRELLKRLRPVRPGGGGGWQAGVRRHIQGAQ